MPINADYEFAQAQKKVDEAKTIDEKIRALEYLLSVAPSHKGAENLRSQIKQNIAKLKAKEEKDKAKKKGSGAFSIKKEGAAQVVLVGMTNSGKSYILNKMTGSKIEVASYPFTTKNPEQGAMDYEGVKIQLVELPAIFDGFYDSEKGPSLFAIMRECDLIVVILDGFGDAVVQLKLIEAELRKGGIYLDGVQKPGVYAKKGLVCVNKKFSYVNTIHKICSLEDLKQNIWDKLDLVYVQTKMPGKKPDWPPVCLKKGSTVKELAEKVHKDFLEKFKYARIWGPSVKHNGTTVGLEHVLDSKDIVEMHLK